MLVADLERRMSARELLEWSEFLSLSDEDFRKGVSVDDQVKNVFRSMCA
jgi:hypothetical protein